ncbi:MAG TPA: dienelactone hydrolase family protein, partial [Arachidicoccus sp.]
MKNHDFNTITVADGTEMELYTAFPDGAGPFPAIIVLQEAFGVTAHIRKVAEGYCKEGYAVVSPDLFHR